MANNTDPSAPSHGATTEHDPLDESQGELAGLPARGAVETPSRIEPYALSRAAANDSRIVRNWAPLGTVDAGAIADCDQAGLVQMRGETWCLDWWIGAEDRWHYPSIDAAVRQRRIGDSPVLETAMRVPGGDIIQRVFGVRATSAVSDGSLWDDSAVIVEIENLTAVPVALALTIRPYLLDGIGSITSLSSDGSVILVDGAVAAVLSKSVARRVVGELGTVATRLANADDEQPDGTSTSAGSCLEGAFVVALPHTAVVRILLPRSTRTKAPSRSKKSSAPKPAPTAQWDAPDAGAIDAGWAAHTKQAARVELPDSTFDRVVARSESLLLLAATDEFFAASGTATAALRAAELCDALVRVGLTEPLGPIARALLGQQRLRGSIRMPDRSDATVALLHVSAPLLAGKQQELWAEDLVGPVAQAIHRLSKGHGVGSPSLLRSAVIALGRVAPSLRAVGQPEVADAAEELASSLWESVGTSAPVSPTDSSDSAKRWLFAEGLTARSALAASDSSAITSIVELCRIGDQAELPDCTDAQGLACGAMALDPAAVAVRVGAILDLALIEEPTGLVILPVWSDSWFGSPVEAHGLRTRWGVASFALRWHGERPALLWEVIPGSGVDPTGAGPQFTAPGLDPSWSATGWTGEALLAPMGPVVVAGQPEAASSTDDLAGPSQSATAQSGPDQSAAETAANPQAEAPREGDSFT